MFGTSPAKVAKKIDGLVDELDIIGQRITDHEEQFELARKIGVARGGEDETIQLWRRVQNQLISNLPKITVAMLNGEEDHKQVNRVLRMTKQQIREVAADISAADTAAEAGRKMARKRFGGGQ